MSQRCEPVSWVLVLGKCGAVLGAGPLKRALCYDREDELTAVPYRNQDVKIERLDWLALAYATSSFRYGTGFGTSSLLFGWASGRLPASALR
jgi:hypothetical protein